VALKKKETSRLTGGTTTLPKRDALKREALKTPTAATTTDNKGIELPPALKDTRVPGDVKADGLQRRSAVTPEKTPANDLPPVLSNDPAARKEAMTSLVEKAKGGDAAARQQLRDLATDFDGKDYFSPTSEAFRKLGYDEQRALKQGAVKALAEMPERTPKDYKTLTDALGDVYTRDEAAKALEKDVAAGNPDALKAVRSAVQGPYSINDDAADVLAKAGEHLKADDYQLLAKSGLGEIGDSAARDALAKGVKDGRPGALDAVREALHQPPGEGYSNYEAQRAHSDAARILGNSPQNMNAKDVAQLQTLANKSPNEQTREDSLRTLGKGALADPPTPGTQEAFTKALQNVPPRKDTPGVAFTRDENDSVRQVAREMAGDLFDKAKTPEEKAMLAPAALRYSNDPQVMTNAADALQNRASAGDPEALSALAKASGHRGAGNRAAEVLDRAAQSGQADKVTQALLDEYKRAGNNDRGQVLESLGKAASQLPTDSPQLAETREALRNGLNAEKDRYRLGHDSAARGMEAMADKLQPEDIQALKDNLSPASGKALAKAADTMPAEQRDALRSDLREALKGNNDRGALAALGNMPEHLTQEDVAAIAKEHNVHNSFSREQTSNTLGNLLKSDKASPEVKQAAARGLLDGPKANLMPDDKQALIDYTARSGNDALKKEVMGRLPTSPFDNSLLERVADRYSKSVSDKLKNPSGPNKEHWEKLGKLLYAKQLAQDPKWKGKVDTKAVDQKINSLVQNELAGDMGNLRNQAIRRSIPGDIAYKQEQFLKSEDFQNRLKLMSPEQQKTALSQELSKLAGVAPERARSVADHLAGRAVQDNALGMFQSMKTKPEEQTSALQAALQNVAKGTNVTTGMAQKITGLLNEMDKAGGKPGDIAERISKGLARMENAALRSGNAADAAEASRALKLMGQLKESGKFGTVLSGAGLLGLAAGGVPKNAQEWASAASSVMGAAGNASDIGKLLRVGEGTKLASTLKFMDWLGPAGDLVGAGVDAYGSYKDFEQGDNFGGSMKAIGAASGLAGAGAGIAILAGASGPAAPAVLLGAAIVGLGAWGLDALFGKSEEQSMLENLGVWK
jgi:hypothetical protein